MEGLGDEPPAASEAKPAPASAENSPTQLAEPQDDCGCSPTPAPEEPHTEEGPQLGVVDADPTKPFPQWQYSRQTYANGPYLSTNQEVPSVHVQDYMLHIARHLNNPGADESYIIDIRSPRTENNATSRGSTASVEWAYRRLSGTSASSFDAKYELTIRVWDQKSPDSGRIVFRRKESMWLPQIPIHAGFALKDFGQHEMITTRNDEAPKSEIFQVNDPTPEDDGLSRRLASRDRLLDAESIAYTTDERVNLKRTYGTPSPDENGEQDFKARVDIKRSGFGFTEFHSYASAAVHYHSDGQTWRIERRFYDRNFPDGHLVAVEEGEGSLGAVALSGGAALPKSGTWRIKETATGLPTSEQTISVRELVAEVAPLTSSLFQDNGGSLYQMKVRTSSNWAIGTFRWFLTLRDSSTGKIVRSYDGDATADGNLETQFFQIWDGLDEEQQRVPNDTPITPELTVVLLEDGGAAQPLARSVSLLSEEDCGCNEIRDWLLTGRGGIPFNVDDDIELFINGRSVYQDTSGVQDTFPSLSFKARAGDRLRIAAKDTFGICSNIDPLDIQRVDTGSRLKLTQGYRGPCDDRAYGLIFFDEEYFLESEDEQVEAIFRSQGADFANETRNSCEALAWTRTASKPPLPYRDTGRMGATNQFARRANGWDVDPRFNIPGQYTPANYPGVSLVASDIHGRASAIFSSMSQISVFSSPVPITITNGSGRYQHAFADLVVWTRSAPLFLGRTHASDQQGRPGNFGWNWSFDEKLVVFQNQAYYLLPDGSAVTYQDEGDGYKPAMSHITTQLVREDERNFRFDFKGGGSAHFRIPAGLDPASPSPVHAVPVKTTDTNGISNTFLWDKAGTRLLKMQGPNQDQWITLRWDRCQNPRLLSAQDSNGRTVCYDYKGFRSPSGERDSLLSRVTLTGNRSVSFRYHPVLGRRQYELLDVFHNDVIQEKVVSNQESLGQLLEVTHRPDKTLSFKRDVDDETGEVETTLTTTSASGNMPEGLPQWIRHRLDKIDRIVAIEDAEGNQVHCEWDDNYNLVRTSDLHGRELRMAYDARRNLISTQDHAGRTSGNEWDAQDNQTASIDPLGRRSTSTYDSRRNPLTVTDPLGHTSTMAWDALGSLVSLTNNIGNQVKLSYDQKGFVKSIELPATGTNGPARTTLERNRADEIVRSRDALGRAYEWSYDSIGRITDTISPAVTARYRQTHLPAARAKAKFNRNDQLVSVRAVDGRTTSYGYDLAERLVEVQETGYPAPTRIAYDSVDNVVSMTRPNGAVTQYEYDRFNRVTKVQYPGGDTETLSYNLRGNVTQWVRGDLTVLYEYDSLDRVTRMHCPSTGDDYHYNFDAADRLLSVQDQTGTTTYEYTQNDLLSRVTHPGNRALSYTFDDADRLVRVVDPENVVSEYFYNQRNQLIEARHAGAAIRYSYDILGRATQIHYPNGVRGTQAFDERNRLLFREYRKPSQPLVTLKYAYNQLGQRILDDRTMPNGNQLARFTYNQRLELVKSKRERNCQPPEIHTYAYDLNHNLVEKDGLNYSNNLADQLLTAGTANLSYNGAGQATDVANWDITYNCSDQITGIQAPGKNIAYRYDAGGQRVSKSVNGTTSHYLWDGGDIRKEYAADGSVKAEYFLGAGREGIKSGGQWYYYLSDIQGSTLMLTDAQGNPAATYDYTDYGETRQTSGSTALYNPFLYTGQEYDAETGLYHLRARHYSPGLGRFFARDPIRYAGGSNIYAYCGGDPIGFIDPSGLFATSAFIGVGADMNRAPYRRFSGLSNSYKSPVTSQQVRAELGRSHNILAIFAHHYPGGMKLGDGITNIGELIASTPASGLPKILVLGGCASIRSMGSIGSLFAQDGDRVAIGFTEFLTYSQLISFSNEFMKIINIGGTVNQAISQALNNISIAQGGATSISEMVHVVGNGNTYLRP